MIRGRRIACGLAGAAAVVAVAAGGWLVAIGPPPGKNVDTSHSVLDREGRLLRAYATPEGRWRLPASVEDVDPRFVQMLLSYEDKRFYEHVGVDPFALGRAAFQLIRQRHIVSGASTLSMQVARLMEPRESRSFSAKFRQITRALQLELALSKAEILSLYLTLAPYGGNLEGIRAASLSYFGKEPRRLTLGEAALLVALPQSPELRRPDRNSPVARAARDRVLDRVQSIVPQDEIARAKMEGVPVARRELPVLAPHAADQVVAAEPVLRTHKLTIDAPLQKTLQDLARERAVALGPQISVAVIAVDNATGEVRARVGSADYFSTERAGAIDMTQALRSPGSSLKPFIYALAFENGVAHPETILDDRPARYGLYAPENFDLKFQGQVTARRALRIGYIDDCLGGDLTAFAGSVTKRAQELAAAPDWSVQIAAKREARARDEATKPLAAYRDEELAQMRRNFYGFDPSYHVARHHFVRKSPVAWTPRHLARHRELGWVVPASGGPA